MVNLRNICFVLSFEYLGMDNLFNLQFILTMGINTVMVNTLKCVGSSSTRPVEVSYVWTYEHMIMYRPNKHKQVALYDQ